MGSQGIKRRKRRRRPPSGEDPRENWELSNSPYTFEGQIEGLGRFGRGLSSASPRMRLTVKVLAALFIAPFLLGLVTWLID